MPAQIIDGYLRNSVEGLLATRRSRTWLATPFMSFRIAQWISTTPSARSGDRRLLVAWDRRSLEALYLSAAGVEALRIVGFDVR